MNATIYNQKNQIILEFNKLLVSIATRISEINKLQNEFKIEDIVKMKLQYVYTLIEDNIILEIRLIDQNNNIISLANEKSYFCNDEIRIKYIGFNP